MAVQLVTYELFRAAGSPASARPLSESPVPLAPGADMERFYAHLQQVMDEVDFKDRTTGGTHLMTRIRRLFQRCEMDQNEVNILRGIPDLGAAEASRRRRARMTQPPAPRMILTMPASADYLPRLRRDHARRSARRGRHGRMPDPGRAGESGLGDAWARARRATSASRRRAPRSPR